MDLGFKRLWDQIVQRYGSNAHDVAPGQVVAGLSGLYADINGNAGGGFARDFWRNQQQLFQNGTDRAYGTPIPTLMAKHFIESGGDRDRFNEMEWSDSARGLAPFFSGGGGGGGSNVQEGADGSSVIDGQYYNKYGGTGYLLPTGADYASGRYSAPLSTQRVNLGSGGGGGGTNSWTAGSPFSGYGQAGTNPNDGTYHSGSPFHKYNDGVYMPPQTEMPTTWDVDWNFPSDNPYGFKYGVGQIDPAGPTFPPPPMGAEDASGWNTGGWVDDDQTTGINPDGTTFQRRMAANTGTVSNGDILAGFQNSLDRERAIDQRLGWGDKVPMAKNKSTFPTDAATMARFKEWNKTSAKAAKNWYDEERGKVVKSQSTTDMEARTGGFKPVDETRPLNPADEVARPKQDTRTPEEVQRQYTWPSTTFPPVTYVAPGFGANSPLQLTSYQFGRIV